MSCFPTGQPPQAEPPLTCRHVLRRKLQLHACQLCLPLGPLLLPLRL